MPRKKVFISFDFENDKDLPGNLVAQAEHETSPFSFVDRSLKWSYDENWKRKVRNIIKNVDLVIFLCGERTGQAKGVAAEMSIVQQENKPYFLLQGRREKPCTRPQNARREDQMHEWTWRTLTERFSELT